MKAKRFQKSQKLVLLILPLLAVVAISGCTGTTTTGATFGNGVTVLNWEPSLSSVESGDGLQLRLRMQNQGQMTAGGVSAFITGIVPGDWGIINSPTQPVDLAPPDRVQGTAGETREFLFNAVAPNIPKGTTQTFTPQVRVFYIYTTTASKLVTLVNNQELQRLQDQGKTLSSKDTVSSAGPLKVTINTGKFLKTSQTGLGTGGTGSSRIFPITIDIQNVGGGMVTTTKSTVGNPDYSVTFKLESSTSNLNFFSSGTQSDPCSPNGGIVQLWKGQTASVTCDVQILNPPLSTEDENLMVTLGYTYFIDASTTVSVTGINEANAPIPVGTG